MLEELINELATVAVGLAILGGSYIVWLLSGIANVIFTEGRKWSWKKMFEDLAKALIMCVSIFAWVAVFNAFEWFTTEMGADITELLDGATVVGLVGGIIGGTVYFMTKGYKNFYEFINTSHTQVKMQPESQNYKAVTEAVCKILGTPKEAVEAHKKFEEEAKAGGLGTYYNVPISTYDEFRDNVIGKGFNLDDCYGWQCWDGACLLWQQLGRWLETGDGTARGCWKLKKEVNAGTQFDLVYNLGEVKRGDVIVFDYGEFGHIGFADEDYNGGGSIRVLGQNQTKEQYFTVVNISTATFLGAFRYEQWVVTPKPRPEPSKELDYVVKAGDMLGQIIVDLGFATEFGLWGDNGDVAYYARLNNIANPNLIYPNQIIHFKKRS